MTRPALRLTRRGYLVVYGVPIVLVLVAGLLVVTRSDRPGRVEPRAFTPPASAPASVSPSVSVSPVPSPSRSPAPVGSATRSPSPRPRVSATRGSGTGRLAVVPGRSAVHGSGPVRRFLVEVESGIGEDPAAFAAAVERVLFDPRGWRASGIAFQRVDSGPVAFRVVLASPATTDRLCRPLRTGGIFSCYMRGRSVVNLRRWRTGAAAYGGDLASYRVYVVNHEVGHALGRGHVGCPASGVPAPVMMQQTKGVGSCRPNPWPLPSER